MEATWIKKVLDEANNRCINYTNRFWISQNAKRLDIRVCVEDCVTDLSGVARKCAKDGTVLVQEGKRIPYDSFNPKKEALVLIKYKSDAYLISLYSPEE